MISTTYLEAHIGLDVAGAGDPEQIFVALADAFHALPDRTVRDIAFNLATREVTMSFTFAGNHQPDEALRTALVMGRTAFHQAGLGTGNDTWDLARWNIIPSFEARRLNTSGRATSQHRHKSRHSASHDARRMFHAPTRGTEAS